MAEYSKRIGVATLELVLALPVLLTLIVVMIWLGYSLVGQAAVTVEARHAAWSGRLGGWDGRAFDFNASNVHESNASTTVEVTPMLSSESGPEARCSLEQGNWDHRNIKFEAAPNLALSSEMMLAATTVGLISDFEDLRDLVGGLKTLGRDSLEITMQEIASELTNPRARLESESQSGRRRLELDRELEKSKAEGALRTLREELGRTERELRSLEEEAVDEDEKDEEDNEDDGEGDAADVSADQRWLLERRIERLEIEIELAEKRLGEF